MRWLFAVAVGLGVTAAGSAPLPKARPVRPALLCAEDIPDDEPVGPDGAVVRWFLVDPDGTGKRPYRDANGRTPVVSVPGRPVVLYDHFDADVRGWRKRKHPHSKTILLANGTEVNLKVGENFVVKAAREDRCAQLVNWTVHAAKYTLQYDLDRAKGCLVRARNQLCHLIDESNIGSYGQSMFSIPVASSPDKSRVLFYFRQVVPVMSNFRHVVPDTSDLEVEVRSFPFVYDVKRQRIDWIHNLVRQPRGWEHDEGVTLSRDGTSLVYRVTASSHDPSRRRDEVHVADLDGRNPRRVGERVGGRWTFEGPDPPPQEWTAVASDPNETGGWAWPLRHQLVKAFQELGLRDPDDGDFDLGDLHDIFRVVNLQFGELSPDRRYALTHYESVREEGDDRDFPLFLPAIYDSRSGTITKLPTGSKSWSRMHWVWVTEE